MARLCRSTISDISEDLIASAEIFAKEQHVICVLKDAGTVVSNGSESYINTSGNSGMATAGSGDVLTGVIAGLLALGFSEDEAAALGVFLHGRAGAQLPVKGRAFRAGKRYRGLSA